MLLLITAATATKLATKAEVWRSVSPLLAASVSLLNGSNALRVRWKRVSDQMLEALGNPTTQRHAELVLHGVEQLLHEGRAAAPAAPTASMPASLHAIMPARPHASKPARPRKYGPR